MADHIDDPRLVNAASSYACQIADHCFLERAGDIGVIVIIARPTGDGNFKLACAATIDGKEMDGPIKRRIFKALHNDAGVVHSPNPQPTLKAKA